MFHILHHIALNIQAWDMCLSFQTTPLQSSNSESKGATGGFTVDTESVTSAFDQLDFDAGTGEVPINIHNQLMQTMGNNNATSTVNLGEKTFLAEFAKFMASQVSAKAKAGAEGTVQVDNDEHGANLPAKDTNDLDDKYVAENFEFLSDSVEEDQTSAPIPPKMAE